MPADRVDNATDHLATVYLELDAMRTPGRCHFCTAAVALTSYDCPDFYVQVSEQSQEQYRFEGAWLACRACQTLIESDEFTPLLQRACQLRRQTAEATGAPLTGTRVDRNLAIRSALRGFMGAVPNGPWRRDLAAIVDGAVSLDRLNPEHTYYIQLDLRPESGGEGEQYLFGGTPSEIEGQLIAIPLSVTSRLSRVQIRLGTDLYPVRSPVTKKSMSYRREDNRDEQLIW